MPGKLSRKKANREHMLRNLCTSLVLHESITTTEPKAKLVKSITDSLLSDCRTGSLASRRRASEYLFDPNAVKKIFEVINNWNKDNNAGVIKMTKLGFRLGDAAKMVKLEIIKPEVKAKVESSEAAKPVKTDAKTTVTVKEKAKPKSTKVKKNE